MPNLLPIFAPFGELITDKKLADKGLLEEPIIHQANKSFPIESDKLPVVFSISAQGQLSVNLFNDENDRDDLNLVGTGPEAGLHFDPAKEAYLKYDIQVFPSGSIQDIGLDINRKKGIRATLYRKHHNQRIIDEVVKEDLAAFPTTFVFKDLEKMRQHDALAYSVEGELKASVSISWSNILSKSIGSLSSLFSKELTIDLDISPKITANFDLSIRDHFSYFLKKETDGSFSVSICKIKNSSLSGGIGASIGIKLSNPEFLKKQLDEILEKACLSLTGKTPNFISKSLKAIQSDNATKTEKETLEKLADLFGVEDWTESLDFLKEKWDDFQDKFKEGITKSAEKGALLSFTYEFNRIKEGKELLKALFPTSSALGKYHGDFLKFDLKPFLGDFTANKCPEVSIQSYFNQTKIVSESAWGFGLKVWGKDILQGKDFRKKEILDKLDIRKHQQVNFSAIRGYKWSLARDGGNWLSQFDAFMPSFSLALEPSLGEFEYGWTFKFFEENINIKSREDLRALLDSGANWGCILPQDLDTVTDRLYPTLSKQKIAVQKQVYYPDEVLKGAFQQIRHHGFNGPVQNLMARALASSLKYQEGFGLRKDPLTREKSYFPIWNHFLSHPNTQPSDLAFITSRHLAKQSGAGNLPKFEKSAGRNQQSVWLADVAFLHPNLYPDLIACLSGMQELGESMLMAKPFSKNFDRSYAKIECFLGQSFYLEVLANFLHRIAKQNPLSAESVEKVFTIAYGSGEEEKTVHLGVI